MEKELKQIVTDALCGKLNPRLSLKSNADIIISKIQELYAPIVNSLKEDNDQNTILLQEKLKSENEILGLKQKFNELQREMKEIAEWKLPKTGKFWDNEKNDPVSYEAENGSNGVREYFKNKANQALIISNS